MMMTVGLAFSKIGRYQRSDGSQRDRL